MTPDRWQRIKTIVGSAVERPPDERTPFIESACGGDVELRAEVERLVGHESEAEGWLEPSAPLEEHIGPYRLLREIARGGMAEVYLAEREDDAFRRRVAIKLLRTGIESADLVRRFEDERQILASVNHPHIAGLYDGGTTASGRPFLVMEYIEGKPIDQYCDENELSIGARLGLFRQVSAAVQFAHQNLVIHRDLKPENILVTAEGAPKLLDFGIAKILTPDLSGPTPATRIHGLPMTPEYASPEQARGQAVSTASDVYSLGVVLYELLTGLRPYELEDRSLPAMTRVICECDPPRPSECRISPGAARKRGTTVRQLRSSLRGDLDNIVMMALRKEPARRYGLVQTLSEDLERYLQSRPVLARRDTRAYRLSKFAQRHRSALSLAAVLAIVAIGFLASTLRARQRAEREAAKVAAVNEFLQGVLGSVNPARGGKAGVTVLEAIDQALVRVDDAFRDQPELEAAVRNTIGSTLTSLGEYAAAERELERALALRRRLQGDRLGDVGETLYKLALVSYQKGSYDETLSLLEEAAAIQRSHLGNRHPALARTLDMQALVAETRGEWDRAETLYRESLDVKRNALGEENGEVARSLTALAEVSAQRGAVGEAEERFRHALELQRRIQSRELPETLDFFAKLLTRTGRLDEADELLREAEELQRKRYGADHPAIARNLQLGGQLRHAQGRHREALARYEEAVAMFREFLGERHHVVAEAQSDYGECLADVGDYRAAEAQLLAARSALLESFGPHHPETRRAEERLSRVRSERPEGRLRAGVRGAR